MEWRQLGLCSPVEVAILRAFSNDARPEVTYEMNILTLPERSLCHRWDGMEAVEEGKGAPPVLLSTSGDGARPGC